jgi:pantoate--beta-alanine ligase
MKICKEISSIKEQIANYKQKGKTIALVPTMGAIHQGHLTLIDLAKKHADIVIVSIFVNSKQFNNLQDYLKYPKQIDSDIEKLKSRKVDLLFLPDEKEIYPQDFSATIKLSQLTRRLCGKTRPGHFDGVALIITKLFNIIEPEIAIFGQKDFQQLQIIKKITSDLNFNIKIIGAEIIREESGLALSSRNLRLSIKAKKTAPKIYQILSEIRQNLLKNPHLSISSLLKEASERLASTGFEKLDYLEICDEEKLQIVKKFNPQIRSRIFIAVYLEGIRLIDNLELY